MTDGSATQGHQLYRAILEGTVPRQVRLFAAQGLLPLAREEIYSLQVLLAADPDEELARDARTSLGQEPEGKIVEWVRTNDIQALVLDLLPRVRDEEAIWAEVATHANVSDETLRVLGRHGSSLVQDVIITNQVRVLECLEILEDLKANPRLAPTVLRRVREFEEEFIEKVIAQEVKLEAERATVSVEEALAALRSIGGQIPREESMPYSALEDPELDEAVATHGSSLYGRLSQMSVKEKILIALKGSREERALLINSRNRLVMHSVLASPKLSDAEVEKFAQSRSVSDEVLRIIASKRRWMRVYGIVMAMVQNPKAPLQNSLRLLSSLNTRDMARVAMNRNVHPVVRRRAEELRSTRR